MKTSTPSSQTLADRTARVGLVAFGVVHLVIAWLAVQLALGDREGAAEGSGALQHLAEQPFGGVLIWAVSLGLVALCIWQLIEAVTGDQDDDGASQLGKRLASAGRAVMYGFLAGNGIKTALGDGSSGGGTDSMTAKVMDAPGGRLLIGAVAIGILVVGGRLIWKGVTDKFLEDLHAGGDGGRAGTAYTWLGRAGHVAKGLSVGIVGVLFAKAAIEHEPKESGGLDQALKEVLDQPFGPWLLILVALGIGCYGLYCFAWSRHLSR